MKLMVLGRPIAPAQVGYRGTYREQPFHFDDRPEDDKANRVFQLFMDSTDEGGPIADLNTAVTVLEAYQRFAPQRNFELVELTSSGERPTVGTHLLGFDISCGYYYSLIAAAIAFAPNQDDAMGYAPGLYVLDRLLRKHFRAKLNTRVLFDEPEDAKSCLDAMMALQRIQQNLYENPEMHFDFVGVHSVRG